MQTLQSNTHHTSCIQYKGMRKKLGLLLGIASFAMAIQANGQKKPAADTTKKVTPYEKLFKGKNVQTSKGMITLHQAQGKVYFEMPIQLLGKPMLIGSVTESVSHSDDGAAGEQAHDPLCVIFEEKDSIIHIRQMNYDQRVGGSEPGDLQKSQVAPILASYKILAVSPDSSSLVFDPTNFFLSGNTNMDPYMPVGGLESRRTSFKPDRSLLAGAKAFKDNITISSYMSYGVTKTFFGFVTAEDRPSTVLMKRSICLLPEVPMQPRLNDPRIGVFYTKYDHVDARNGVEPVYYANRWRLEPSNPTAYAKGEKVTPVQPIVFYIDNKFPASWVPYIRQGVEQWNVAFEKIGFKDAIVTKMYPENDSTFDPNNIKYNCIKYAPTATQNAMGPSWVDPRTGEILNASVYVYHGITDVLRDWLFIQTSPADKRARTANMSMELVGPSLRYVLTHEVGHCLGLMHNMGASATFPVDSLRSPSFTQKYGTTPSIMDYARFNFVAQPGDMEKGVSMTPPPLGIYDEYAIDWLYRVLPGNPSMEVTAKTLEAFVSEKIKNPMFRYGKQQFAGNLDPNALSEDLGDDQVKATAYAMKNLRYVMENFNNWVKDEDEDYSFRRKMNFNIINIQFYWYLTHVLSNLGGIYQYEKYEGDPFPAYTVVPKAKQKESLNFLLSTLENATWLNNPEIDQNIDAINGNAAQYMQTILFPYIMRWVNNIGYSEAKGGNESYTQAESLADVFNFIWKETLSGKAASAEKLNMQKSYVQVLTRSPGSLRTTNGKADAFVNEDELAPVRNMHYLAMQKGLMPIGCSHIDERTQVAPSQNLALQGDKAGFEFATRILYQTEDISHLYYSWLVETQQTLQKIVQQPLGKNKLEYEYMLLQVNRALKVK
ncbi:uncharacterized protein DUF5118 [Chitinophaga skermanii]|uniref:Uncharacterized protein DUF5118 n=1 Tax=Chitinophaga skermanii TaxID=331697 RepID=A0A327QRZ5_9BACT|nr:zinc-dependent metalloprotease [Chitinophaga skermanii]RAJ06462.1 uncharacterized protein DUF5118 [Chitinophaga skermanii]